ncbi:MAG TPA: sortase [Miltoncostaeaceae bacterium]|nr:sortase [Miltoncostaeaceae bacterium]
MPELRRPARLSILAFLVVLLGVLWVASGASAAEPPNQNDPCSSGGRDTCGTTGVGSYERYRYGVRWFGDYRGAVPGAGPTFCLDLRFWYPDRDYAFERIANEGLRNKEGAGVSIEKQRRMAYALWEYGRSSIPSRQAAVMLYVHGLMGDGAPGEADPGAIGPQVEALVGRIGRDAARFHGPYRLDLQVAGNLKAGNAATGTARVVSAEGNAVPGVLIELDGSGTTGLPAKVRTDGNGVASFGFTPATGAAVSIDARSESIASTLPRIFRPTAGASARNGQRLAAAASQRVSATATQVSSRATISISTTAFPSAVLAGRAVRDRVRIGGLPTGRSTTITANVHGPFRTRADIRCDAAPAATGTFTVTRSGTTGSPVVRPTRPGFYTYQLVLAGDAGLAPVTTPCGEPAETFVVQRQPTVTTKVSRQQVRPGASITDTVVVTGLGDERATVNAALHGPFASREAVRCDTPPVWSGTVDATGDGEYETAPVTLTTPGYYTYRETIAATDFVRATETACNDVAETTVVMGTPSVRTQVSAQQTAPGRAITDAVSVTGLGSLSATVNVEVWGPFATREAITCAGTPYATQTLPVNGDGEYTTPPVTLDRAGFYTYRESIAATEAFDAITTPCGEAAETTVAIAAPKVTTVVSDDVVRPGSAISDTIRVSGLGRTPVKVQVELFGPFASRAAMRCDVRPFWTGEVTAQGDGTIRSAPVRIDDVGFYTYRERIAGTTVVQPATTACGEVAETSLAAPAVNTGRGDFAEAAREAQAASRPTRLRVPDLSVDAPVNAVGINLRKGELAVPADISRTGWWRDGASPGDAAGSILVGGHVDSARSGPGAFVRLDEARAGMRVQVVSADGRTRAYRVVSVRQMPKDRLPTDIWSLEGRNRLSLVTCGGRFDRSTGHYLDNIVVVAVPVAATGTSRRSRAT